FLSLYSTHISSLSLHDALPISLPIDEVLHLEVLVLLEPLFLDELLVLGGDDADLELALRVNGQLEDAGGVGDRFVFFSVHRIVQDRKSTRLNSSHGSISYAVFC